MSRPPAGAITGRNSAASACSSKRGSRPQPRCRTAHREDARIWASTASGCARRVSARSVLPWRKGCRSAPFCVRPTRQTIGRCRTRASRVSTIRTPFASTGLRAHEGVAGRSKSGPPRPLASAHAMAPHSQQKCWQVARASLSTRWRRPASDIGGISRRCPAERARKTAGTSAAAPARSFNRRRNPHFS